MAGQTISTGSAGRKRVLFGLLDSDGWTWASLKAAFWFVTIIMLLGYIPDRAYYFTVFSTIDVGVNVISPINFCPPSNLTLPCPAPAGAPLPWASSPTQLALPAPRTDGAVVQAGTNLIFIGGTDGKTVSDQTYQTPLFNGNFGPWQKAESLPAPRTDAATIFMNSAIYVIGGSGADGKPTSTVFVATQDATSGVFSPYAENTALKLPAPRSSATVVAASDGLIVLGGSDGSGPTTTVWKSTADATGKLGPWVVQAPLPQPRSEANGTVIGSELFIYGGRDATGPTATVLRGDLGATFVAASPAPGTTPAPDPLLIHQWATGTGATNLPGPRTKAAGFTSNGVIYLVGGSDGTSPRTEVYWSHGLGRDCQRVRVVPGRRHHSGRGHHLERSCQPGAPAAVLRPGPDRGYDPGAQDRRRRRPAARLPECRRGRHGRLHPADPDRLGIRPQGTHPRALR